MKTLVLSAIIALVAAAPLSASADETTTVVHQGSFIPKNGNVLCTASGNFYMHGINTVRPKICSTADSIAENWKKEKKS